MPQATRVTIHVLAAVAEHERDVIAQRTRAGLRAAQARGVVLGGRKLPEINAAAQNAAAGFADGMREAGGREWHAMTVHRVRQGLSS